jgi:hypothetical protein
MRSARWAVMVAPTKKIGIFSTVGSQFIGFTAVGLFGRLADLTRPYLIAKRIELPLSSQIAVYTIERMFDLGSAAIIFSIALAFAPKGLPHHEIFAKAGFYSLAGTLFLAVFAILVRASGGAMAAFCRAVLGHVAKGAAESISQKILDFRDGLNALASFKEFAIVLSYSQTMLLMGASIGGSLLQLPVIGWFTQIGVTATAMRTFYGAPLESATACGALLLAVLSLSILPAGFLFAQLQRVSLKKAAEESSWAAANEVAQGV